MFVAFDEMPEESRIWIYQADRSFSDTEVEDIIAKCKDFLTQWSAHGAGLKSSAKLLYNRFLIICVDEKQAMASGCSIDSSVHFVQALGNELKVDFFNRTKVAFLDNGRIIVETLKDIRDNQFNNSITGSTITFNNLVQSKADLKSRWLVPVSESWMDRYFKTQSV